MHSIADTPEQPKPGPPQHTPGPWAYSEDFAEVQCESGTRTLAKLDATDDYSDFANETHANGHLIAAAPDLLEAAKHALRHIEAHEQTARILNQVPWYVASTPSPQAWLREAIAKAEGKQP